uniref:30-kDa protein antigen n=1 Tax=Burkholderia pseudomallei TaxID=28450 RepID=Q9F151_BURPE|nr:30-kDa protein antigen [Burkholderia pseudomallei]
MVSARGFRDARRRRERRPVPVVGRRARDHRRDAARRRRAARGQSRDGAGVDARVVLLTRDAGRAAAAGMAERAFHAFRAPARVPVMRNGTGRRRSPARNARAALGRATGKRLRAPSRACRTALARSGGSPIATLEHGDMHSCRIVISLAIHRIRRFRHGSKQYVTLHPNERCALTPLPYRTAVRRSAAAFSRACAAPSCPPHANAVQAPSIRRRPDRAKERLDAIPALIAAAASSSTQPRVSLGTPPDKSPIPRGRHACKHRLGPYAMRGARPNGVSLVPIPARAPGIR